MWICRISPSSPSGGHRSALYVAGDKESTGHSHSERSSTKDWFQNDERHIPIDDAHLPGNVVDSKIQTTTGFREALSGALPRDLLAGGLQVLAADAEQLAFSRFHRLTRPVLS